MVKNVMMRMKIIQMVVQNSAKLKMDSSAMVKSDQSQHVRNIVAIKFMILNLKSVMIQMELMMMGAQTNANLIIFTLVKIMTRNYHFVNTTASLAINLEVTTGHV